jgi:hypothetical protein
LQVSMPTSVSGTKVERHHTGIVWWCRPCWRWGRWRLTSSPPPSSPCPGYRLYKQRQTLLHPVFKIRIRIRIHRIHMFLGFPDPDPHPDPLVRGMDPDSDPNQNVKDPEHWLNQRQILQCILLIYIDHKLLGCIYLSDRLCLEFEVLTASSYALFC